MVVRCSLLKIGKKLCFPDVPSTWVPRTVESILYGQDCYYRKPNLKDIYGMIPNPPKNNDFEADESRFCNPLCLSPPIPTSFSIAYKNNLHHDSQSDDHTDVTDDDTDVTDDDTDVTDAFEWSFDNRSMVYDSAMNDFIQENYRFRLNQGHPFDVISLLSNNNNSTHHHLVRNNGDIVQVDTLRGKYVLLVCVFIPSFWQLNTPNTLRALFTFYDKQNKTAKVKTEMVVVPKMRRNWAASCCDDNNNNNEQVFNHFFSGFPPSWLAVPFSDTLHRDHICNSVGLYEDPKCLLVDPDQKVELHLNCYTYYAMHHFCNPQDSYIWWKKHTQLDLILDLDSHYVFKTVNNNDDQMVSISELKQKIVGLYLCFEGSFIRTLDMISQECKARNQEFEVVLVYLPYKDGVHPPLFQEAINHVLHKLNISNWWVSPFDDFVSRTLWEAVDFSNKDELVIIDPHTNNADPFAKSVLHWFGINSYPFTRESLVLRELEALREVTLESLLVYGSRDHVLRIDNDNNFEEVPVAQLRGKTVILYVDQAENPWPHIYPQLLNWYNWIKTTRVADDFEVVLVSITPFDSPKLLSMPWLVCPFDLKHRDFVWRKTFNSGRYGYLVVFGKDGHINKLSANDHLDKYGPEGFPPCSNDLCNDIIYVFSLRYNIDMTGVFDPLV